MLNPKNIYQLISEITVNKKFVVAYSGGLDSHVLLHIIALMRNKYNLQLRAIHINHGLSPNAEQWIQHCTSICRALDIPLQIFKVELNAIIDEGESIEAAARAARYEIFAKELNEGECLVTAHTQNDQAETVLLQLLRGAGPKGLAAMPVSTFFATGSHLRPFLNFSRQQLEIYAAEHNLQWITDESNFDTKFARNYVRQKIIPLLKQQWPACDAVLARSAQNCAEANKLLDELAAQDLLNIQAARESLEKLSIPALKKISCERQRNLLRYWLLKLDLPLPSSVKLRQIQTEIFDCAPDANPLVAWQGAEVRRYQDTLYAMSPLIPHDPQSVITWDISKPLILPSKLGVLDPADIFAGDYPAEPVTVQFRNNGEKCRLQGRKHTSDLKKLFQQWKIPPWLRNRIPLIYVGDKLKVIVGYGKCE